MRMFSFLPSAALVIGGLLSAHPVGWGLAIIGILLFIREWIITFE